MLVLEFKIKGKPQQYAAIDEAIRTAQFVRNKALPDPGQRQSAGLPLPSAALGIFWVF